MTFYYFNLILAYDIELKRKNHGFQLLLCGFACTNEWLQHCLLVEDIHLILAYVSENLKIYVMRNFKQMVSKVVLPTRFSTETNYSIRVLFLNLMYATGKIRTLYFSLVFDSFQSLLKLLADNCHRKPQAKQLRFTKVTSE